MRKSIEGTVSVLLGNGDGTFQPQTTFPAGTGPYCLAIADVNGDGKLDLAWPYNVADKVRGVAVSLGIGDGTFQADEWSSESAPYYPAAVATADVNGDGRPDLIGANWGSGTVGVLLNTTVPPGSDSTPPAPDPSTFATPPAWTGSAIRMVATTATDPSGVQYFFDGTAGPGHDSGWQDSPEYLDSVSTPGQYTYKVQTRDKSAKQNASGWSAAASVTVPNATPTFSLSAPASGSSYVVGDKVTIQWAAENVPSNSTINLCADADATYYNGNDNWVTVDKIVAANGIGSYDWDTTSYDPGTYCLGGYMYSPISSTFTTSRSWITLVPPPLPTVTIEQAVGQVDPTNGSPVQFTVVFSKAVTGFTTGDVTLAGTAGATTATVTGSGTTYNVAVSGMTQSGTVIASVPAGVASDAASNTNAASTSTDNTVTVDCVAPQAWLTGAAIASPPKQPYWFKVTYKDDMGLKASTVGAGDIVIYPPKSVKKYKPVATWLPSKKPFGNTKSIVTYYSIPAPGGTWDKADNGVYSVVLVYKHICDVAGNAIAPKKAGLILGTFKVQIGARAAKSTQAHAAASPFSAVTLRPVQKQGRDSLLATLFCSQPVL